LVNDLSGYGAEECSFDRAVTSRAEDDEVGPISSATSTMTEAARPSTDLVRSEAGPSRPGGRMLKRGLSVVPQAVPEVGIGT
jgi:hypothetical protein